MTQAINFAESYQMGLQKRYAENGVLHTQKLWNSPSNSTLKWVGAKTVKVPTLNITAGRKDRQRRTITGIEANYTNDWEVYELKNERYWSTLVDPSDVDETNYTTTIANVTRAFNDQCKAPEKDMYMLSKLYTEKERLDSGKAQIVEEKLTEDNFLKIFDDLMEKMDELQVPHQGRTLFVTPHVARIIKNIKSWGRSVNIQNGGTTIDRRIDLLDEVTIEPAIPSNLMKTAFDFTEGATEAPGAKQIEMLLIHIPCMAAPEKYKFVGLDKPQAQTSGNYLYYEQSYDDVIVFKQRHQGMAFAIDPGEA
ncbi:hypothetical protein SAMN05421767_10627 [Granulicatella balaenopterae]|uniref:Capsid protein n=1 Tax=Granulicatella balaenopterae TaxID=137733 RepID=A0A1H9IMA3_9LACT|nr:capsid protein [Granulicatella balaenopterae]SEQ75622.1 hypothetical protein SAMN05421767_10627 [Granulicatella balaenopterae]